MGYQADETLMFGVRQTADSPTVGTSRDGGRAEKLLRRPPSGGGRSAIFDAKHGLRAYSAHAGLSPQPRLWRDILLHREPVRPAFGLGGDPHRGVPTSGSALCAPANLSTSTPTWSCPSICIASGRYLKATPTFPDAGWRSRRLSRSRCPEQSRCHRS